MDIGEIIVRLLMANLDHIFAGIIFIAIVIGAVLLLSNNLPTPRPRRKNLFRHK